MSTLKSAADLWSEIYAFIGDVTVPRAFINTIEDYADEVRQVCAEDAIASLDGTITNIDCRNRLRRAILAAGKVDERRERLGKALYDTSNPAESGILPWDELAWCTREVYCNRIDAVLEALEEES